MINKKIRFTREQIDTVDRAEESNLSKITALKIALTQADAVLIGAGAGFSTAAGFTYGGERFREYFGDFEEKYGFHDMYSGGFYPYKTEEEYWAFWSRNIYLNRYQNAPVPVYEELLELVKGKDYFVLTTNVDHCFQKAGFDKSRLFYTQGDYGLFQCSKPCRKETFDNEKMIRDMIAQQKDGKIPTELIPKCPHCGRNLVPNLRVDGSFVQDTGWDGAAERYELFCRRHKGMKILYLEIGVGYNTPGIIKYPFWKGVSDNPKAIYACLNMDHAQAPEEIQERSICIQGDSGKIIRRMLS